MELDNLKEAWQSHAVISQQDSSEEIILMLQKKSRSPIAKMKQNLRWEMLTVVVLYTVSIVYYMFAEKGRLWQIALLLFIIGVAFMFYYQRKNTLLKEMECVTCEVKSNLQRQVSSLEKYLRIYFIAGNLVTPVAYFMAGMVVLYKYPVNISKQGWFNAWFIGAGIVVSVLVYFLNTWYIHKLYGQHVKKLKAILLQMEEAI